MALTVDNLRCPQNHRCPLLTVCPVGAITQSGFGLPVIDPVLAEGLFAFFESIRK